MLQRQWSTEQQQSSHLDETAVMLGDPFNLATPRSHCPKCGTQLRALDNLPLLSWLWLRGRCRFCQETISAGDTRWSSFAPSCWAWWLLASTVIQYRAQPIAPSHGLCWYCCSLTTILAFPDPITQPLLWAGLLTNAVYPLVPLQDAVLGAALGYTSLWLVFCFKLLTGKDGMGYGDFKFLAALGAWLGWQALPQLLMIAAALGLLTLYRHGVWQTNPVQRNSIWSLAIAAGLV